MALLSCLYRGPWNGIPLCLLIFTALYVFLFICLLILSGDEYLYFMKGRPMLMLTTDRGQKISVVKDGIQIEGGEGLQVIDFDDIKSIRITESNVLQIRSDDVVMQYPLRGTEGNQDFYNEYGIAKLNFSKARRADQISAGKSPVNKALYIVLAILLGSFGIHKFYAGKVGTGIVFFIFSWTFIPAILGIIDGVRTLDRVPDKDGNIYV